MSWVPLHVHTQYSILEASAPTKVLAKKAAEFGMPAVSITDNGNIYGIVEFYKACLANNVKPIIGCEFYIAPGSRLHKKKEYGIPTSFRQTLLAKNDQGYHNLCKLSSIGFTEGFYYNPRIDLETLEKHHEGLICLSGSLSSRAAHEILNGTTESFREHIKWCQELFKDDFYIELQRHQMSEEDLQADGYHQETWLLQQYNDMMEKQKKVNEALIAIAKEFNIKTVATNDSHYINKEDWRAHEILLNVQSGEPCEIWEKDSQGVPKFRVPNPKRRAYSSHECYFKSPEEMAALFSDIPEAISNTLEVAEKCQLELDFGTKHYPVFVPPGVKEEDENREEEVEKYLRAMCQEGIKKRYTPERLAKVKEVYPDKEPLDVITERLEYEMGIIAPKGMCDYLLIVWDFIHWAKTEGIPVGPGRGSGAGSIVLYLIGITDIEPLRFHLFFERFINPERISYPDIDVDICMDRRGEVIQYMLTKYGITNVAQIITFGSMKAKMTIKDVGRVLSVPLSKVNTIAKLVPEDLNITLEKALEKDPDLNQMYQDDEDARRIIDLGQKLEGSIRNTGIHAAGVIISGKPLLDLIPICTAKDSEMPVTQYSMKPVEQVGMLKIDSLGLKTLTAIQSCVDSVEKRYGKKTDWVNLPLDDKPTFDLLNQGKTLGVFQLESSGMQDLARQLHLDKFEEIIAVGALYRPGPMDMIPSFINRKHGREEIENDHPWIKDILAETYGIMVYQEQVMQIASTLAGFSLGEGDVLRRAMGKKDMEQMATQREKFREGALKNNVDEETSMRIFDKMEKFAAYGFNKSHAAAYGYLSYVTAYLKANYPGEWMAALMTCDKTDLTKVTKFLRESQVMGITMLPPDVNESGVNFVATEAGIRFAMSAIKGVGTGVVEAIVQERDKNGPYENLYEFIKRIDTSKVGKKVIENLVDAGCFDFTKWSRDALVASIETMFDRAVKQKKEKAAGVMTLFGLMGEESDKDLAEPPKIKHPRKKFDLLMKEKELLGFFITGHPMDAYREILKKLFCVSLSKVEEMPHDTMFRTALIIETVTTRYSQKSQKKFAILIISDGMERWELPIWPDLYEEKKELLIENQLLYAVLQVDRSEQVPRLSCRWFDDLTKADESMIQACDKAYDEAKTRMERFAKNKNRPKKEEKKEVVPKKLIVSLDADKLKMSQILELRDRFEANRGKSPVELKFLSSGQSVGSLHVDSRWGVTLKPDFSKSLGSFAPVLHLKEVDSNQ